MIRSLNIWFSLCGMLTLLLIGQGSVHAQETKRVAIKEFTGPSAGAFQAQVSQALKQESTVELVSSRELKSTASRLGSSLDSSSGVQEVGEALELSAIVEGEVVKKGRGLQLTVRVRNASTGEVEHEEVWNKRRSQVKTLKPQVMPKLGPAIRNSSKPSAKPKAKPKPVVAEVDEDEEEEEPAPKPVRRSRPRREAVEEDDEAEERASSVPSGKSAAHPALVASLGPRLLWRTLQYVGDTNLSSYKNPAGKPAFALALSAQYYPGAHSSTRWYSDLGLDVDLDYALGLKSKVKGSNKELATTAYSLGLGAIWRFYLGDFEPRIRLGYVKQVFEVDVPPMTYMPSVSYSALRFGVGTAINFVDWLAFDVNIAYLFVLGTGELDEKEYGNDVSSGGWEAGAGFLARFKEVYGVRLALDYRRFSYDFSQAFKPTDVRPDGGSVPVVLPKSGTDGYLAMTLSFVYTLPGAK